MNVLTKKITIKLILIINFFLFTQSILLADNHNINETLQKIIKDIKTLEKAVYLSSVDTNNEVNNSSMSNLNNKHFS